MSNEKCHLCGADLCQTCGHCSTEHNEDPVCNCPGTKGNPRPPTHVPQREAELRRQLSAAAQAECRRLAETVKELQEENRALQAACAEMREAIKWAIWLLVEPHNRADLSKWADGKYESWGDPPTIIDMLREANKPNAGQPILDENARLRTELAEAKANAEALVNACTTTCKVGKHPTAGQVLEMADYARLREVERRLKDDGLAEEVVMGAAHQLDNQTRRSCIRAYRACVRGDKP